MTMKHVLVLDLKNDADAASAYRHWHRPGGPPAAVTEAIRQSGIAEMEIWQVGDRLVMTMETTPEFDPAANARRDAGNPDIVAWEKLMDQFQKRLPFAPDGAKWVEAERIYTLADQP